MPRCRYPRPQRSCMAPRSAYSAPFLPYQDSTSPANSPTQVMDHALVMLPQQSTSWPSTGTIEVLSSASRENTHSNEEERMLEKELKTRYRTTITSKGGISQRFTQQAVFRDGLLFRARRRGHFPTTRFRSRML